MEIYVNCFENYEISNYGNIRRKMINGEYKTIKGSIMNKGYRYFQLNREGVRKNFLVHQLVAKHFLGERPEGVVVDHVDRNKLNNHVANLRYLSFIDNLHNCDTYKEEIKHEDRVVRAKLVKKMWGEKNKERLTEQKKEYYLKIRDKLLERYLCLQCGKEITKAHKSRHDKKYHT